MIDYQNDLSFPKWPLVKMTVFNNQNDRYLETPPKWTLFMKVEKRSFCLKITKMTVIQNKG